jgi:hypothetical protein
MATDDFCGELWGKPCADLVLGPLGDVVMLVVAGTFIVAVYLVYRGYRLLSKGGPPL